MGLMELTSTGNILLHLIVVSESLAYTLVFRC